MRYIKGNMKRECAGKERDGSRVKAGEDVGGGKKKISK